MLTKTKTKYYALPAFNKANRKNSNLATNLATAGLFSAIAACGGSSTSTPTPTPTITFGDFTANPTLPAGITYGSANASGASFTIKENVKDDARDITLGTVAAADAGSFTYSISEFDGYKDYFAINPSSGEITLQMGKSLDSEDFDITDRQVSLKIVATAADGGIGTYAVTMNIVHVISDTAGADEVWFKRLGSDDNPYHVAIEDFQRSQDDMIIIKTGQRAAGEANAWRTDRLKFADDGANTKITVRAWGDNDSITVNGQHTGDDAAKNAEWAKDIWFHQKQTATVPHSTASAHALTGGEDQDYLEGNIVADNISAQNGNDILRGYAGDDEIHAGAGNDILYGGEGGDVLYGGNGSDVLYGGAGRDFIHGNEDADRFVVDGDGRNNGNDTIYIFKRAEGDKIVIQNTGGALSFTDLTITGKVISGYGGGQIEIRDLGNPLADEDFIFANGTLYYSHSSFIFDAAAPIEATYGTITNVPSTRYAKDSNTDVTTLYIREGLDSGGVLGKVGIRDGGSVAYAIDSNATFTFGSDGNKITDYFSITTDGTLSLKAGKSFNFGATNFGSVDDKHFSFDVKVSSGSANLNRTIKVQLGDHYTSTLGSTEGTTTPGGGTNTVTLSNGDDLLEGGAGLEWYNGGAGNDIMYGSTGHGGLRGGAGNDILYANGGQQRLFGGDDDDTLYGNGDTRPDELFGEDGNDILYGSVNDSLYGGGGDDILYGGGTSAIDGGTTGNANSNNGADKFVFSDTVSGVLSDTIKDFNSVQGDKIVILHADENFDTISATNSGANAIVTGFGVGDNTITVEGVNNLTAANFEFVAADLFAADL